MCSLIFSFQMNWSIGLQFYVNYLKTTWLFFFSVNSSIFLMSCALIWLCQVELNTGLLSYFGFMNFKLIFKQQDKLYIWGYTAFLSIFLFCIYFTFKQFYIKQSLPLQEWVASLSDTFVLWDLNPQKKSICNLNAGRK